ncbi:IS5 family transposase [Streptomyces termitum]|uniref:IS5 family transposase n=1 Tax=Streptomyces termitum TaxID=67368 RepID=UPI0033A0E996
MVSADLWERIEPLPPKRERQFRDPGRKPVPDRQALCGILFVPRTGIQREHLPQELGFGAGMTCWRRLRDWKKAGVWQRLHEVLLAELNAAARLDWPRAFIDFSHVRVLQRGLQTEPSPVGRERAGSMHHLITDGHGTPLAVILTGGNRNDVTQLMPLLDAVPSVCRRPGRPRRKPQSVFADRGHDHDVYHDQVRARRILPVIVGVYRSVVERTFAWLHGFKRLRTRRERRADLHQAFLKLACCLITHRQVLSPTRPALAPSRQTDPAN